MRSDFVGEKKDILGEAVYPHLESQHALKEEARELYCYLLASCAASLFICKWKAFGPISSGFLIQGPYKRYLVLGNVVSSSH